MAPDHPEVKNVINTFTKTASNENVRFIGNVSLGCDISLAQLKHSYNAVVLVSFDILNNMYIMIEFMVKGLESIMLAIIINL